MSLLVRAHKEWLVGNLKDNGATKGAQVPGRLHDLKSWHKPVCDNVGYMFKTILRYPDERNRIVVRDSTGAEVEGINFASQDYLGLARDVGVAGAVRDTIARFGVHSAGSPALLGTNELSIGLEKALAAKFSREQAVLFPTGWGAAYGTLRALVTPNDVVILDQYAHASLMEGATTATKNIVFFNHLDNGDFESKLKRICETHHSGAIFAVTEGVFSMDADSPDLRTFVNVCRAHNAVSIVDVAHDFGAIGANGGGALEVQGVLGDVDIVIGTFSKAFASNGGFVASNIDYIYNYLTYYSGPRTFSNGMSPMQLAAVSHILGIVESDRGAQLRVKLCEASRYLRQQLLLAGFTCYGPSDGSSGAIVPVLIGAEGTARLVHHFCLRKGVIINFVEYPAVARGKARLRIQLNPFHTKQECDNLVAVLMRAFAYATQIVESAKL